MVLEDRREGGGSLGLIYAVAIPLLLAPLVVFKYWNWLAGDFSGALSHIGVELALPDIALPLPIGISFFTFQAIAYLIDVGRSDPAETHFLRFSTFIGFVPQLVAGPIVRRSELLPQLERLPDLLRGQVGRGLFRISRGMVKKIILADILRVGIVDPLFTDPQNFTGVELLIGLYAYTLQIYYDFSGYTDIAIGSALLFGITLPENFRRPYKAVNVTDFWRRWHITLSLWVRHYVYFPIGGARGAAGRVYFNLLCVFLIIGVWHGASWNFVAYGLLHGLAMAVNRWFRKRHGRDPEAVPAGWWPRTWRVLLTLHFIVLARILFRAEDFGTSWVYLQGLWDPTLLMPRFSLMALMIMALGFAIHFSPDRWQVWAEGLFAGEATEGAPALQVRLASRLMSGSWAPVCWALALSLAAVACLGLGTGEQLSFIYYSF
jgi:D-alanyl-lipoteichoic acid acyltransferase DltB (MBOAT superfamily)